MASRRLGWLVEPAGFQVERLLGQELRGATTSSDIRDWLKAARPDAVFEATSLSVKDGQPAIDYIREALEAGAHAITANKGTIVHAYEELDALAEKKGKRFLFESTVMDGAPIFSLFRESMPAVRLNGIRGILNSTTNVILSDMENGMSFEESVKRTQEMGLAETDPSHDVDGWDAAVKITALVRVLMQAPL